MVLSVVVGLTIAGPARAQVATNLETGDNRATTNQGGSNASGDAVGGQVSGVVANGRTSVDARNVSKDSSVESGEAATNNTIHSFTGLKAQPEGNGFVQNTQDGDNRTLVTQTADATTGDAISGQIIGAVTEAGGSASIVANNRSENNDVETGVSTVDNFSDSFVGLDAQAESVSSTANATNTQDGDNRLTVSQDGLSGTGNGIAGQVVGVVSAGATSVDADNTSTNNDVNTVDTASDNSSTAFVGLDADASSFGLPTNTGSATNNQTGDNRASIHQFAPGTANSANVQVGLDANASASGTTATGSASNDQEGDNRLTLNQDAPVGTASVDSVAGQVVGAATAGGGSASIVVKNTSDDNSIDNVGVAGQVVGAVTAGIASIDATNTSKNNDVDGGVTSGTNDANAFVGLDAVAAADGGGIFGVAAATATNIQDGDNRGSISQTNSTTGGMPVAGQVIGAVTAGGGSSDIVAANTTENSDVKTGDAEATNEIGSAFAGQLAEAFADSGNFSSDVDTATNQQIGDDRFRLAESASATSGNGVGGQVIGVVSAGRTSVDASNKTSDSDVETGGAFTTNTVAAFVGELAVAEADFFVDKSNFQDGDNSKSLGQTADATSGDAIAGQVTGVVQSAGGTASVVVSNESIDIDAESGVTTFDNSDSEFVGLQASNVDIEI
jgi:hypothetical protein